MEKSPEYQIDSQKYISSAALPEVALAQEQSFNRKKDDSWLGKVKVRLSQMEQLPGNREVQREFVKKYFAAWGMNITGDRHPMAGILTSEPGSVRLGASEFLPSHLKVYLCHGQHRKRVLENAIQLALTKETMAESGDEDPEPHEFQLEEVHQHKDGLDFGQWMSTEILTFSNMEEDLEHPKRGKNVMKWSWSQFERVQKVGGELPGNLLEPKGEEEWTIEPGMFYHAEHLLTNSERRYGKNV
ncbi:uncharacterized protein EI90DRAFT_3157007 [Cantharellus anzutake]|uniref:uncharacterized protein n=1 Tax=Cantharellus anzutake TaxID=1750568 RepID=UPI001906238B|nr:uncharacterized protein EI90DRAFT_3157007 [Cantharellus anzutake]KAF8325337.1 hypothetical protein EI90DRAFT_3157007 [Cantharellus anzutake]